MAIISTTIKTQIDQLINTTKVLEQAQSQEAFAQGLADIIVAAILSATVNPGIPVQVVIPAGTGATTGPGTLS